MSIWVSPSNHILICIPPGQDQNEWRRSSYHWSSISHPMILSQKSKSHARSGSVILFRLLYGVYWDILYFYEYPEFLKVYDDFFYRWSEESYSICSYHVIEEFPLIDCMWVLLECRTCESSSLGFYQCFCQIMEWSIKKIHFAWFLHFDREVSSFDTSNYIGYSWISKSWFSPLIYSFFWVIPSFWNNLVYFRSFVHEEFAYISFYLFLRWFMDKCCHKKILATTTVY